MAEDQPEFKMILMDSNFTRLDESDCTVWKESYLSDLCEMTIKLNKILDDLTTNRDKINDR